jgi:hypothetical protein
MQETAIWAEAPKRTEVWVRTVKAMAEVVQQEIMKGNTEKAVQVREVVIVTQGAEIMTATTGEVKTAIKIKRNLNSFERL